MNGIETEEAAAGGQKKLQRQRAGGLSREGNFWGGITTRRTTNGIHSQIPIKGDIVLGEFFIYILSDENNISTMNILFCAAVRRSACH